MGSPLRLLLVVLAVLPWTLAAENSSAAAAALAQLPTCAVACLISAVPRSSCAITNQTCICTDAPLQNDVALCVAHNCTITQALMTKNITETACNAPVRDKTVMYTTISITLGVLSGVFVVMRLAFKLLVAKTGLGLDDWFILITILAGVPSSVLNVHGTTANGLGRDVWTLTPQMITNFGMFFYVMEVLYFMQVTLLKLSMLFFYLRIFPAPNVRKLLWATVIFNTVFGVVFVFVAIFQCNPVSYFWLKWDGLHQGTCMNINAIGWANAAISIALDTWMLAIPLSQLRALKLHWKKKIGVGLMFCVGTFVTVVSILRLQSLVTFANSQNPTWDNWDVSNWSTIEINVGIICACMPSLRLVLVRLFPVLGGSSNNTGRYQYYSSDTNKSKSRARGGSRTLAEISAGGDSQNRSRTGGGITFQKSYAVQYGDHDEASLVRMRDLDLRDGGISKSPRSNTSEVSV